MRRGVQFAERFVISKRRDVSLYPELIGEADLVAFTGGDASLALGDKTKIIVAFRRQRELDGDGR
jgi:hypothetical protein